VTARNPAAVALDQRVAKISLILRKALAKNLAEKI
jgi:hypothetical protein